jgi:queuosine biosynthesis protein QueC
VFAASFLITKGLTRTERPTVIVVWQSITVATVQPAAGPAQLATPTTAAVAAVFLVCGLLGSAGHYCLTRSFSVADISATQSVKFLDLVWASLLGWLVFADVPSQSTLIGGLVICASTIWIARREARSRLSLSAAQCRHAHAPHWFVLGRAGLHHLPGAGADPLQRVETIGFDYGQRHSVELQARLKVLAALRAQFPQWAARLGRTMCWIWPCWARSAKPSLTRDMAFRMEQTGLPNTFVPGRNLLFLTLAAALAYRRGLEVMVTGVCETDFSGYPDCRDDTMKAMQLALSLGMDKTLPDRDAADVDRQGRHLAAGASWALGGSGW